MRITVLSENTSSRPDIGAEHGLSLYIETAGKKILFDAGQTDLFAENAVRLGIDLSQADFAVLSHGHYDHGGGLKRFLEINSKAPVYISRHAFGEHYNGTEKYIGLDRTLAESDRLVYTDETYRIDETTTLFSPMHNTPPVCESKTGMTVRTENGFLGDTFRHEQFMLIKENGRKYLFSGCSHSGILNVAEWFSPDVLVGGFHLSKVDRTEILSGIAERLNRYDTEFYTCHCTGVTQYEQMKLHMRKLNYISAGTAIEI